MKNTLKLADGEAQVGQTVWYVDTYFEDLPELKSTLLEGVDMIHQESYIYPCDDSTPCFITKNALFDYCQENDIECLELERDVYKERLESMEKSKNDLEKFLVLCDGFGINTTQTTMAEKNGNTRGSFVAIANEEMEIRFTFGLYGDFKNFYFLED